MIPVSSAISSGLTWSKVSRNRSYELKLNDEIVGTLQHPGFFSPDFLAKTEDGQWTFRRAGLLGAGTQILDSASHQQLAMFKSVWGGGGDLTFADGATFHLTCKGSWRPVWTMIGAERQPVLHVHVREKTVDVLATGIPASRLSLLIMFTWYRMLQAEEDAASAAMVAVMVAL